MASLPKFYKKLTVKKFSSDFRSAVGIDSVELCKPTEGEVCIRNRFVGANAWDINVTKGIPYLNDTIPFDIGLEAVGEIAQVGPGVKDFKVGDAVTHLSNKRNAYAEYSCVPAKDVFKVPVIKPEYLVFAISGLTASIGLFESARIKKGETILVTAAAGGLGHVTVQIAKIAGCHVIGTCSSEEKVKVLKDLGCDRVINHKKEDIAEVLTQEYPKGVDVVWETFGGRTSEALLDKLAIKGRFIIVGGITGYKALPKAAFPEMNIPDLPEKIFYRSASVQGFLMLNNPELYKEHFECLLEHFEEGKIKVLCDFGKEKGFEGVEGIIDSVEYLHTGKSIGKVMVKIP